MKSIVQAAKENLPKLFNASRDHNDSPAGNLITDTGSAMVQEVEARAKVSLPSIASDGLHGVMDGIPPSSGSHVSIVGDLAKSAIAGPNSGFEENLRITETSRSNPIALVGDVMGAGRFINVGGQALAQREIACSGNAAGVEARANGLLPSTVSDRLHDTVQVVPLPSGSQISIIGDSATSTKPLVADPSLTVGEAVRIIKSSATDPLGIVGNIANAAPTGATDAIKDGVQALLLARLRGFILVYVVKLPIVGPYFKRDGGTIETLATETTPLLGVIRDPKAFAAQQAESLLRRVFSPLSSRLPSVDALDAESDNHGLLFSIFVECYVLAKEGGGWFFTHLQEHSLVVAPTVSLGHLSTIDLAASTIGTTVASVTGYSIIQGFISSLDKVLDGAPDRHAAKIACVQAGVITGIVLFPITNIWVVQSATLLQRFGQPPEVAGPASEFLRVAAAGLPGHAISEIAKRYLTSQGLSHVYTRILSVTTPLNLALNYLLVDGPVPALRLGFIGAPLCTVLSHNALAIMLILYIAQRAVRAEVDHLRGQTTVSHEPVRESSNDHLKVTFFTGLGTLIFAGISGVLRNASQIWSKDFGGVVAGILGPNALATQAVLHTTATTLYQAPRAVGSVSSNRIKKWITNGNIQHAKIAAVVAFVGTFGVVIVISNVLLASAASWGELFNNDPAIVQNVAALLPVIAIFQAIHGLGASVDCALGSLGKTAVFPSLSASADYFLGIPLGVYLALPRRWGLAGLWTGLTISLAYSCFVATIVLVRTNWKNAVGERENVTREEEEVQQTEPGSYV